MPAKKKATAKRPPGRPKGITKVKASVSLSETTHAKAVKAANALNMSLSAFVDMAVANQVKPQAKAKP